MIFSGLFRCALNAVVCLSKWEVRFDTDREDHLNNSGLKNGLLWWLSWYGLMPMAAGDPGWEDPRRK